MILSHSRKVPLKADCVYRTPKGSQYAPCNLADSTRYTLSPQIALFSSWSPRHSTPGSSPFTATFVPLTVSFVIGTFSQGPYHILSSHGLGMQQPSEMSAVTTWR